MPPAFVLSQDQTLRIINSNRLAPIFFTLRESDSASFYLFSTSAIPVGTGMQYFAYMAVRNTSTATHTGSLKVNNPSVQGGTTNVNAGSTIYIKSYSGSWRSVGTFRLLKSDQTINVNL